jgi:hypothetical protein
MPGILTPASSPVIFWPACRDDTDASALYDGRRILFAEPGGKCMQVTILRWLSVKEHVAGQLYTGVDLPLAAETDGMPR